MLFATAQNQSMQSEPVQDPMMPQDPDDRYNDTPGHNTTIDGGASRECSRALLIHIGLT